MKIYMVSAVVTTSGIPVLRGHSTVAIRLVPLERVVGWLVGLPLKALPVYPNYTPFSLTALPL
jgi:hypothetical protein